MKKTMKAAVVREFGKPLTIEDVPIPSRPGQVLVKSARAGVGPICMRSAATGRSPTPCSSRP
jgi:D-arabinose 1-dehydrogenase-like Zn-dependent alcohol dehydrogenase